MKNESDGIDATRTARCASASATTGPTAATRVRASAACTCVAGATANSRSTCDALVNAIASTSPRVMRSSNAVTAASSRFVRVDVRCDCAHARTGAFQKIDQRFVRFGAVELNADGATRQLLRAECRDDAGCRRNAGGDVRLESELAQRARRFRSARDLAHACELRDEAVTQLRLMLVDAREESAQSFARQQDQVVARAAAEPADPVEHGRRIRRIEDRDQRTAQHSCAAPFEHRGKHVQLARFRDGDGAACEGLLLHMESWRARPDSNWRPSASEADTLSS